MMELTFLGTSAMIPTKDRNHTAMMLLYEGEAMLFDCGEGTQRQIRLAKISPGKITKMFITHWHGDHVLGIPGLVQTLGASEYNKTLRIYGPKGTQAFMEKILKAFLCEEKISMQIKEVEEGIADETPEYTIKAMKLMHTAPTLAYCFQEKDKLKLNMEYLSKFGLKKHPILKELQQGKNIKWEGKAIKAKDATITKKGRKLSIVLDTGMNAQLEDRLIEFINDSDVLVMESTFGEESADKAKEYTHLTAAQAAKIAKKAKAKRLFLTHFSQRYSNVEPLKEQAAKIFKNAECARDLQKVQM